MGLESMTSPQGAGLLPSALLPPLACGPLGQGLCLGEEQGQRAGGEGIVGWSIQGLVQNQEQPNAGVRMQVKPRSAKGARRPQTAPGRLRCTPRPGASRDTAHPAELGVQGEGETHWLSCLCAVNACSSGTWAPPLGPHLQMSESSVDIYTGGRQAAVSWSLKLLHKPFLPWPVL